MHKNIVDLTRQRPDMCDAAAELLYDTFRGRSESWQDLALLNVRNRAGHLYESYVRVGFTVVGVMPDANGPGKPDIFLAKRVERVG